MSNFSVFEDLEKLNSRNDMTEVLVKFFSTLDSNRSQIYIYLLQGRVAPLFVDKEFNFSEKSAIKVLEDIVLLFDLKLDINSLRVELGDAGLVAQKVLEARDTELTGRNIDDVYDKLWRIINTTGSNSARYKADIFSDLILKSDPIDAKFLTRIISGKLRLGCSDKTVLDAFSFILSGDKSSRDVLDSAYGVVSDLGLLASIVCGEGDALEELRGIKPVLGIPIFPRLVERVSSFQDAVDRFPDGGILQPKFDGLRCQVHKGVGKNKVYEKSIWSRFLNNSSDMGLFGDSEVKDIKLFSRNLNDITAMFPDVVDAVKNLNCDSCILDGEVIGWDAKKKTFLPFQETMQRKRKYGVDAKVSSMPVKYFTFDIIYFNGKDLINTDLFERLETLKQINMGNGYLVEVSDSVEYSGGEDRLKMVFNKYVANRLEGLILKKTRGGYHSGVRNYDWVKIKKSIEGNVVDTIDTVILGYYYGSGKKTDFGMGSLLVGVYNSKKDIFESVGKVGTGIKDGEWELIKKRLTPLEVIVKPKNIITELEPDVWILPEVVITVEADEISKSSTHIACTDLLGFGLSLRFPRLINFDRDKLPVDATSTKELAGMWEMGK